MTKTVSSVVQQT